MGRARLKEEKSAGGSRNDAKLCSIRTDSHPRTFELYVYRAFTPSPAVSPSLLPSRDSSRDVLTLVQRGKPGGRKRGEQLELCKASRAREK